MKTSKAEEQHRVRIEIQEKGRQRKTINLKSPQHIRLIGEILISEIFGATTPTLDSPKSKIICKPRLSIKRSTTMNQLIKRIMRMTPTEANDMLEKHLWDILPVDQVERYKKLRNRETLHIAHVRNCMNQLLPDKRPNLHDHSKNELYFFITSCHFQMKDTCTVPKKYLDSIIASHHKEEAHHPEYEKYNKGKRISDEDIMEMVVDRLSRNLQGNGGAYDQQLIEHYYPSFQYDRKRRLELYKQYVDTFKPLVEREWHELTQKELQTDGVVDSSVSPQPTN